MNEEMSEFREIEFLHIQGRSPTLVILDDANAEVERIDLTAVSSVDDIFNLLAAKGFRSIRQAALEALEEEDDDERDLLDEL